MLQRLASLLVLFSALCGSAFASPEQWVEVSSPHFTVITDSTDQQARHTLDQFERMRWMFHTLFPNLDLDLSLPVIVVAAKDRKTFQSLEPAVNPGKGPLNPTGLFLKTPDRNYFLLRLDAEGEHPFATVYREYTRLQFSNASEWLPLWLNEGFTEFFQNTQFHNKDVLLGDPNMDDILYLRQNQLLPLATLFKVDVSSPYSQEQKGSVFSAESWALTHYLEAADRQKGTHRVPDYMALVSRNEDPAIAAEKAFGDLKQLQLALESYIHESSYKQVVLSSAAAPLDEASYRGRTLTPVESGAVRANFLVNARRTKDARALLDTALQSAPDNVPALDTMGYLAFRDGDKEAARKWYEKAVRFDSQSSQAHYYLAALSIGDRKSANDAEIEANLRTAIRLSPNFAPAYDQLANLLVLQRGNLETAFVMSAHAVKLDPRNLAYRFDEANVFAAMGQYLDGALFLRSSVHAIDNADDLARLLQRAKELDSLQTMSEQASVTTTTSAATSADTHRTEEAIDPGAGPKHPAEQPNGPKHFAIGVIRGVQCSYPAVIEFHVETAKKPVSLYTNNYFKIDFTALGFTPKSDLNPCKDIEGMKVRVQYAESSDKSVDGQVIAVELRK
jgi:tetratricopeptide (TPR) repeat protein